MITQLGKPKRFVAPGTCLYRAPIKMGVPSDSCAEPNYDGFLHNVHCQIADPFEI